MSGKGKEKPVRQKTPLQQRLRRARQQHQQHPQRAGNQQLQQSRQRASQQPQHHQPQQLTRSRKAASEDRRAARQEQRRRPPPHPHLRLQHPRRAGGGKGGAGKDRRKNDDSDDYEDEDLLNSSDEGEMDEEELAAYEDAKRRLASKKDWPEFVYLKGTSAVGPGMSRLRDVHVHDVRITVPGQTLLDETNFKMAYGVRYGLVGRNGTGKSVLLKTIAHREAPFDTIPKHLRIVYVEQEIEGDDRPPLDTVLQSNKEREWLLQERARFEEAERLAIAGDHTMEEELEHTLSYELRHIDERLHEIRSDRAVPRAATILAGLGFFDHEIRVKPTREYSGGWRMRVAIAQALFQEPEFLFLDEPTNHLDVVTAIWLEDYLSRWRKGLLVVSHDAQFLDGFAQNIVHLHGHKLAYYRGAYSSFAKARANKLKANAKQVKKQKKADDRIKQIKQKDAKMAKNRQKQLDKRGRVEEDREDPSLKFGFPDPGQVGHPVLSCSDMAFHYPPKPDGTECPEIFRNVNFGIHENSRIALIGQNGVGKTTLMNLLAGELQPTRGAIIRNDHLRVARFHQHHIDDLTMEDSATTLLRMRFKVAEELPVRKHLAKFGITGDLATKPICQLSGGQKSRVAFASIAWSRPHLMMLDEPTNHLDMPMIDSFANALKGFPGPIVLITHNQFLIEAVCDEIWIMKFDGSIERFEDGFDEYRKVIINNMPTFDDYEILV